MKENFPLKVTFPIDDIVRFSLNHGQMSHVFTMQNNILFCRDCCTECIFTDDKDTL